MGTIIFLIFFTFCIISALVNLVFGNFGEAALTTIVGLLLAVWYDDSNLYN